MNSIVLDLEWNQAQTRDREAPGLTFEVIEIGAVRLDEHGNQTDSFSCLIRPCVYTELFYRVREVVGISMKQLEAEGIPFLDAMERFWKWCGKDPVFFTWGDMDLGASGSDGAAAKHCLFWNGKSVCIPFVLL